MLHACGSKAGRAPEALGGPRCPCCKASIQLLQRHRRRHGAVPVAGMAPLAPHRCGTGRDRDPFAPASGWASCRSWSFQARPSPSWQTALDSRARPAGGAASGGRQEANVRKRRVAIAPTGAPVLPWPPSARTGKQPAAGGASCSAHLLRGRQRQLLHRHLAAAGGGHHPAAPRGARNYQWRWFARHGERRRACVGTTTWAGPRPRRGGRAGVALTCSSSQR